MPTDYTTENTQTDTYTSQTTEYKFGTQGAELQKKEEHYPRENKRCQFSIDEIRERLTKKNVEAKD